MRALPRKRTFCACRGKIQDIAIQLADRDNELQEISPGLLMHHARHCPEAHGSHDKGCECLHIDDKGIPRQIARVCLSVFLPCKYNTSIRRATAAMSHTSDCLMEIRTCCHIVCLLTDWGRDLYSTIFFAAAGLCSRLSLRLVSRHFAIPSLSKMDMSKRDVRQEIILDGGMCRGVSSNKK